MYEKIREKFYEAKWAVSEWFLAHAQGFKGLVIGLLLGGVLAARIACQAGG